MAQPVFDGLETEMRRLALLSSDVEARRGLRLALCEGRRAGFTALTFAGITFNSNLQPKEGTAAQRQDRRPSPPPAARRRSKTPARKQKDAEKFKEKRMKRKLLAVLPIINKMMTLSQEGAPKQEAPASSSPSPAPAAAPAEAPDEEMPQAPLAGGKQHRDSPGGERVSTHCGVQKYSPSQAVLKKARHLARPGLPRGQLSQLFEEEAIALGQEPPNWDECWAMLKASRAQPNG